MVKVEYRFYFQLITDTSEITPEGELLDTYWDCLVQRWTMLSKDHTFGTTESHYYTVGLLYPDFTQDILDGKILLMSRPNVRSMEFLLLLFCIKLTTL